MIDDYQEPNEPSPEEIAEARSRAVTCSPLASYEKLVKAANGQPTGAYQLRVGDLYISTNEWDKAAAEKWLPIIVAAVNAHTANA